MMFSAQSHHRGFGQRGQDDHPLPVSDQGSCPHVADRGQQRGAAGGEKHPLSGVGHRRPVQPAQQLIVILVVDSTDRARLTLTKDELHRMLAHEDLQNAAVLVLANKQDVKGSMTAAEISRCLTLDAISTHTWHVQACCGLTGEGLTACLDWMRSKVVKS
ncbi:putative ADP-ribosylation factor-like protein 5C isoform X3 [Nerophis ophidion]|uniref:putative ADP-ribosylation factor-like protein 5C isoform X3 n=1 Tax=Nerophis ophidion TaxID=159077 RepID=UPI002ADFCD82|nr:putative ADP-ribosylation factor-like protein 5C isoform X3 [Nerophis ophidion]